MTAESNSPSTILVSSRWLEKNLDNPRLRIINADSSPDQYNAGHIPGAIFWQPRSAALFCDEMSLYLEPHYIEPLLGIRGIEQDSCVVFTSEQTNGSTWLVWLMTLFGLRHAYVLEGGNAKWRSENRILETTTTPPVAGQ